MSPMDTPLRRASEGEVHPSQHWDIRAVFEIEKERIDAWLKQAALRNLSPENSNRQSALEAGSSLPDEIRATMGIDQKENRDPTVKTRADNGALQDAAPSRGWLKSLAFLKWLFMLAEVGLFVVQWLVGVSSPIVILHGVALAGMAYLVGNGLATLSLVPGEGGRSRNPWLAIVVGLVGIVGLTALRASGGGEGVWVVIIFTLVLAALIILFEYLHLMASDAYEKNRRLMFQAQKWVAKDQHIADAETGLWWQTYERYVKEIAQERDIPRPLRDRPTPVPPIEETHHEAS